MTTKEPFPITRLAEERRLRVFRDPCWGEAPPDEREWFLEIRGKRGALYGNDDHEFWIDTTSGNAKHFSALGPIHEIISPDGREARFLFHISAFDAALEVLQPRKKRTLSPERQKALVEAGRKSRFFTGVTRSDKP